MNSYNQMVSKITTKRGINIKIIKKVNVHDVQQLLYLFVVHPVFTYSMWEFWEKRVLKLCFLSACFIDCKKKKKKKKIQF